MAYYTVKIIVGPVDSIEEAEVKACEVFEQEGANAHDGFWESQTNEITCFPEGLGEEMIRQRSSYSKAMYSFKKEISAVSSPFIEDIRLVGEKYKDYFSNNITKVCEIYDGVVFEPCLKYPDYGKGYYVVPIKYHT